MDTDPVAAHAPGLDPEELRLLADHERRPIATLDAARGVPHDPVSR